MLPWLVFTAGGIIVQITLVISFMIAVADYGAVAIFLGYEYCNFFLSETFPTKIIPSQMEVAPLHCTVDITQKRRLFKNTKEIEEM